MRTRQAKVRRTGLVFGFAALAVATAAQAKPAVDPEAISALDRMGGFLRSLQQMHLTAEMTTDEVLPTDQKVQRTGVVDVNVRRPDRLVAKIDSDRKTE